MTTHVHILGIYLGKNWFHLIGIDRRGEVVLRKKLYREKLMPFLADLPICIVSMES